MNEKILVSIGIPTYNRVEECVKAVQSILEQTYQNIEIIISDNSDNNATKIEIGKIIDSLSPSQKQIRYTKQKKNIGVNPNFLYVLNQAQGKYFMFLEDEMELDKNYISKAVSFLESNKDFVLASGNIVLRSHSKNDVIKSLTLDTDNKLFRSAYIWTTHHTSIFYSLSYTKYIKTISIHPHYADDRSLLSKLAFIGKFKTLDNIFNIRTLDKSFSNQSDGYKRVYKSLNMTYRCQFFSQLNVSRYAFRCGLTNPFIKNSLKKLFHGTTYFLTSIAYTILYQNIYLKVCTKILRQFKKVTRKNSNLYRRLFYIIYAKHHYKKFFLGNGYLKINDYNKIQQILSEISQSNYSIYGAGKLCDILLYEIKRMNLKPPSNIILSNKAEPYKNFNTITPDKLLNTTCKYVFIASYSYKEEMIKTLKNNKYTGKILYLD